MTRLPASLYVHVPFCRSICRYCDFGSTVGSAEAMAEYLDALDLELGRLPRPPRPRTIYVGGGTPTALPKALLERFLGILETRLRSDRVEEFSIEANPGTLTPGVIEILLRGGVNRVSLGVQTFDDRLLRLLGRVHDANTAHGSIQALRASGLENLSIDLIFGIPGGDRETWRRDLEHTVSHAPDHVSTYGLTIEPNTTFARWVAEGRVRPPDEDLQADCFEMAGHVLEGAGYRHYEIANHARPGRECLHNLGTWRNAPYLGFGPAAASFVGGERRRNVRSPVEYVRRLRAGEDPVAERETLEPAHAAGEALMLALRTSEGITAGEIRRRHGVDPLQRFRDVIERYREAGLLEVRRRRLRLTKRGRLLADEVLGAFVSPDTEAPVSARSTP